MADNPGPGRARGGREPLAADFIIPLIACGLAIYYLATTTDLVWEARAAGVFVGVPLIAMCVLHMGRTLYRIASAKAASAPATCSPTRCSTGSGSRWPHW